MGGRMMWLQWGNSDHPNFPLGRAFDLSFSNPTSSGVYPEYDVGGSSPFCHLLWTTLFIGFTNGAVALYYTQYKNINAYQALGGRKPAMWSCSAAFGILIVEQMLHLITGEMLWVHQKTWPWIVVFLFALPWGAGTIPHLWTGPRDLLFFVSTLNLTIIFILVHLEMFLMDDQLFARNFRFEMIAYCVARIVFYSDYSYKPQRNRPGSSQPPASRPNIWVDFYIPVVGHLVFFGAWTIYAKHAVTSLEIVADSLMGGRNEHFSSLEVLLVGINAAALVFLSSAIHQKYCFEKPQDRVDYQGSWLWYLWSTTAVSICASFGILVAEPVVAVGLIYAHIISELFAFYQIKTALAMSAVAVVFTGIMFIGLVDDRSQRVILFVLIADTHHYTVMLYLLFAQRDYAMASALFWHHGYDMLCTGGLVLGYYSQIGWQEQAIINTLALVYMYDVIAVQYRISSSPSNSSSGGNSMIKRRPNRTPRRLKVA